jgi:5-(carboxyamino)imidazole ribonucleotide synthase
MPAVGMVGGGQLARMTAAAAVGLGATFRVLAESPAESAALVARNVAIGSHRSLPDIASFAAECDVITFDHEHVPGAVLAALESAGVLVRPGSAALRYTQDKLAMRERLSALGVPCPRFAPVSSAADLERFAGRSWPVVLKAVSGGYDGKGVWVCASAGEAREVIAHGVAHGVALLAEEFVPFRRELAALVARSPWCRPSR